MTTPHRPHRPANHHDPRGAAGRPAASPAATDDGPLLYTPAEAAKLLRVRESWLRKKAAARAVPCTFLGKHLRFSPTDLAAIVAAAARPATGRRHRRKTATNSSTVRDRDLPTGLQRSVHPPDRDDHSCEGSSTWPG
jgi:excisionase family DNA binding protein